MDCGKKQKWKRLLPGYLDWRLPLDEWVRIAQTFT